MRFGDSKSKIPKALLISFIGLTGCKPSSFEVLQTPPNKKEEVNQHQKGFFYTLPEVFYTLHVYGHRHTSKPGELQDFGHLLKMPLPKESGGNALVIDSIDLIGKAKPDPDKRYFVSTNGKKPKLSETFSQLPKAQTIQSKGIPFLMNQSRVELPLPQSESSKEDSDLGEFQASGSFQENLTRLLNQNNELLGTVQKLSSDSTFQSDSLLLEEVKRIRNSLEGYQGRINELKKLFNTFKDRDLGARARELSDIIHKLVELKTGLAGGQQDINYTNTDLRSMLNSLDSMIGAYQTPFLPMKNHQKQGWSIQFKPVAGKSKFQFGLKKAANSKRYYIEPSQSGREYLATFQIRVKKANGEKVATFQKVWKQNQAEAPKNGFFYNIPASAKINVQVNYKQKSIPLGVANVTIPQLGKVSRLPAVVEDNQALLNPFDGSLNNGF